MAHFHSQKMSEPTFRCSLYLCTRDLCFSLSFFIRFCVFSGITTVTAGVMFYTFFFSFFFFFFVSKIGPMLFSYVSSSSPPSSHLPGLRIATILEGDVFLKFHLWIDFVISSFSGGE